MRAIVVLALVLLAVFGLLPGLAVAEDVVKVGDLGIVGDGPMYIGIEKGWFKQ